MSVCFSLDKDKEKRNKKNKETKTKKIEMKQKHRHYKLSRKKKVTENHYINSNHIIMTGFAQNQDIVEERKEI